MHPTNYISVIKRVSVNQEPDCSFMCSLFLKAICIDFTTV